MKGSRQRKRTRPLFGVNGAVCSKKNLTEPTLLEMSGNPTNQDLAFYGQMELESGVWEIEHRRLLQRRFLLSVSLADCLLHRLSEVKLLAACHIIGLWLAQAVHHLGKSGPISFYSSGLEAALFYFFGHSD